MNQEPATKRLRELAEAQQPPMDKERLEAIAHRMEAGEITLEDVQVLLTAHNPKDPDTQATLAALHPVDRALALRVSGDEEAAEVRLLALKLLRHLDTPLAAVGASEPESARSRGWFRR